MSELFQQLVSKHYDNHVYGTIELAEQVIADLRHAAAVGDRQAETILDAMLITGVQTRMKQILKRLRVATPTRRGLVRIPATLGVRINKRYQQMPLWELEPAVLRAYRDRRSTRHRADADLLAALDTYLTYCELHPEAKNVGEACRAEGFDPAAVASFGEEA